MKLRNDNTHRIYYDEGRAHVEPGGIFEGSDQDAKRPHVSKVTGAEADAHDVEQRGEGDPVVSQAQADAAHVKHLSSLAALAGTAPLRGEAPHQGGTLTTASAGEAALKGSDTGEPVTAEDAAQAAASVGLETADTVSLEALRDAIEAELDSRSDTAGEVTFASDQAKEAAGDRTDLAPGGGSGKDGAYTVADLK